MVPKYKGKTRAGQRDSFYVQSNLFQGNEDYRIDTIEAAYYSCRRLRLLAFLEGVSLLLLVFVAVPIKYFRNDPAMVKAIGPIHGAFFLLFVFSTLKVGVE